MRSLQSQKRSVQNKKCGCRKSREDSPLEADGFPKHVPVAQGLEPEHIHVIRQRGPTAEEDAGKDGEDEEKEAAATPRRMRPRPVNGLRHCSTPSLPFLLSQFVTTLAKFHSRVRLIVGAIKPEPTPQALNPQFWLSEFEIPRPVNR